MSGLASPFPFRLWGGNLLHQDLLVRPTFLPRPAQLCAGHDRDGHHLVTTKNELVGVVEYMLTSTSDDDDFWDRGSFHNDAGSTGSTHPSRECFMAEAGAGRQGGRSGHATASIATSWPSPSRGTGASPRELTRHVPPHSGRPVG